MILALVKSFKSVHDKQTACTSDIKWLDMKNWKYLFQNPPCLGNFGEYNTSRAAISLVSTLPRGEIRLETSLAMTCME